MCQIGFEPFLNCSLLDVWRFVVPNWLKEAKATKKYLNITVKVNQL